jgi:hypothetical protein
MGEDDRLVGREQACESSLEGIISKRAHAPMHPEIVGCG